MRPRRILRRFRARASHWGTPHVHCPSCGGDTTVPPASRPGDPPEICFVCHVKWFRLDLTGDEAADWQRIRARAEELGGRDEGGPGGKASWAVVWRPLLVDCPAGDGGKRTETMECAFGYLL